MGPGGRVYARSPLARAALEELAEVRGADYKHLTGGDGAVRRGAAAAGEYLCVVDGSCRRRVER